MGIRCNTYCQTCNFQAPELGDGGMMGNPTILDEKEEHEDYVQYNFGWIYSGLQAISLLPHEVEAYKAFLEEHNGHKIVLSTDNDEPDIDWDKLIEFTYSQNGFVNAIYEIESETGEKFQTGKYLFKKFAERELTAENIQIIMEKLFDAPSWNDSIYRVAPSVDPYEDLERLELFFRQNNGKKLIVRLVEEEKN